jgi:hypothetical protein
LINILTGCVAWIQAGLSNQPVTFHTKVALALPFLLPPVPVKYDICLRYLRPRQ